MKLGKDSTETLTNVLRETVKAPKPRLDVDFSHHMGLAANDRFLLQLRLNGDVTHSTLVSRHLPFKWFRLWCNKRYLLHKFVDDLYKKGFIQNNP